jgi:hypothetical protein
MDYGDFESKDDEGFLHRFSRHPFFLVLPRSRASISVKKTTETFSHS